MAKPTDKAQKLSDAGGLYLLVHPNGSKYWRLKYRFLGKEKVLAIGIYPQVTLSEARTSRDDAKKLLTNGKDPSGVKQNLKAEAIFANPKDETIIIRHEPRQTSLCVRSPAAKSSPGVLRSNPTRPPRMAAIASLRIVSSTDSMTDND